MNRLSYIENELASMLEKTMDKRGQSKFASLSIKSDLIGMNTEIVRGEDVPLNPMRPQYMAGVGKLFTATLVGMLKDEGVIDFDDYAYEFLDDKIIDGLHVLKGVDHSKSITIRHLLMHTSGLKDVYWNLEKPIDENDGNMTPHALVAHVKANTEVKHPPGRKVSYANMNYYILGLVVEGVTGKAFHEAVHEKIFNPLKMERSSLMSQSEPANKTQKTVPFKIAIIEGLEHSGYAQTDYAAGSVTGPLEDFTTFMKAFSENRILKEDTKAEMVKNTRFMYPGIHYGMGVWVLKSPWYDFSNLKYAYGVFGATGSFMVYHPKTRSVITGSFNDDAFRMEAVRFVKRVIKRLLET